MVLKHNMHASVQYAPSGFIKTELPLLMMTIGHVKKEKQIAGGVPNPVHKPNQMIESTQTST